ncbi:MAG: hypothetical protein ACR2IE_02000 [Candidatus Sumerlaeaceae bacterium]
METRFTIGALRAAKAAQDQIKGTSYIYAPEEAAVAIDKVLDLPSIISLITDMVDEAKRDLATNPDWTGPTVRINRSRLKELSNILSELKNG